jgi:hypothetical protein
MIKHWSKAQELQIIGLNKKPEQKNMHFSRILASNIFNQIF